MRMLNDLKPLIISVKRGRWRDKGGVEPGDQAFAKVRSQALAKDEFTCVYCSFKGQPPATNPNAAGQKTLMEVHHKNDDHDDNHLSNLVTTCPLCHSVNHIGFLSKSGLLFYLPEISQEDLNHLFRTVGVALTSEDTSMKEAALAIMKELESLVPVFMAQWKTANPADIANALMALNDDMYAVRDGPLAGVRVYFRPGALRRFGEGCNASVYSKIQPKTWDGIASKFLTVSEQEIEEWKEAGQAMVREMDRARRIERGEEE